jgi:hypothetical protein
VTTGDIRWVGNDWQASDGTTSVDLNGGQAGDLRQSIVVIPGRSYVLSFDLAGDPDGSPATMTVFAGINELSLAVPFTFNTSGHSVTSMGWERKSLSFAIPTGYSSVNATVVFSSGTAGAYGPAIDNVSVRDTCSGEIHGTKFRDDNVDGVWNGLEPGLPQWTFVLNGPVSEITQTGAAGDYAFTGLPPGNYTVTEVLQPNWKITSPVTGSHSITVGVGPAAGNDFGNCQGPDCVAPPTGMIGWWNMDDLAATARDVVGPNNGAWVPSVGWVNGKVSQGARIATWQYIKVPHHGLLNAFGNFSIDAWVSVPVTTPPQVAPVAVVSKVSPITMRGYQLVVGPSMLQFMMVDGGVPFYHSHSVTFTPGVWYHVAVVVDRSNSNGPTVTSYVDGSALSEALTISNAVGNTADLTFGHPSVSAAAAQLDVDEIEIFRKALTGPEVTRLWQAGSAGKCRSSCQVPSVSTYLWYESSLKVCTTITNVDPAGPHTYAWALHGLPTGPGCDIPGPLAFSPATGTVTVGANSSQPVCVTIPKPAGLGPNQRACYEIVVSDLDRTRCFACSGSLSDFPEAKLSAPRSRAGPIFVGAGISQPIPIVIKNEGGHFSSGASYAIRPFPSTNDSADIKLALNGLPPGEPVIGTLDLAPGDSVVITVMASYPDGEVRYPMDELRVELDQDGDGRLEVVQAYGVIVGEPGVLDVLPLPAPSRLEFSIHPNPFSEKATIALALSAPEMVGIRVFDIAGRLVQTLMEGKLQAGRHTIEWDGRDAGGRLVSNGVYFVRVAHGNQRLTRRFVRMD